MYSHAGPIRTELNDVPTSQSSGHVPWDHPDADPMGDILRFRDQMKGEYDRMLHRDWCDDGTCWCRQSTTGDSPSSTT